MQTLKSSARRTVRRERGEGEATLVVKRFHAPGALQQRRDRGRARREHACHERLSALGLPVPEPLGVRHVPRVEAGDGAGGAGRPAWELVTRCVEDATSLRELLDRARRGAPLDRGLLARLGTALAQAHAAGLDHPDLHAGNVLIDARGEVWLVDLSGARVRRPRAGRALRDLVRLGADLRECVDERGRARALCAWRRALRRDASSAHLAAGIDAPLALELERRVRVRRRASVWRQRRRWTRSSSVCVELELAGRAQDPARRHLARLHPARRHLAWLARGLERGAWLALLERPAPTESPGPVEVADRYPGLLGQGLLGQGMLGPGLLGQGLPGQALLGQNGHASTSALVLRGRWRTVREIAFAAARLAAHGLPTVRPALLARGPEPSVVLAVPQGAIPVRSPALRELLERDPERRAAVAAALGTLAGGAHDRGLEPRTADPWVVLGRGGAACIAGFGPTRALARARPGAGPPGAGRPDAWLRRLIDDASEPERRAFLDAWVAAHRSGAHERTRLAAELARG